MRVTGIGAYSVLAYRGGKANITHQEAEVVQAAKKELEMIKEQGKKAGTDAAWWRSEFGEAKAVLESIVKNECLPTLKQSSLMSFHDSDEDGFI
jgi:hypothetical protein